MVLYLSVTVIIYWLKSVASKSVYLSHEIEAEVESDSETIKPKREYQSITHSCIQRDSNQGWFSVGRFDYNGA